MEEQIQKRKGYKDKYTLIFIGILLTAIVIRFYYFWITKSQAGWWDEMDYMSAAKAYAGIGFANLTGQRLPGFPLFMSLFFKAGIQNEVILRLLGCFIPSIVMLILLYFTVSKMYADKRIALISTAIMAFLCESLFYSNRFQTENFGLIFQFGALISMYAFLNTKRISFLLFTTSFAMTSVFMRPGQMLFIPAVVLFLIITQWKNHKTIVITSIGVMLLAAVGLMVLVPSFNYIIASNMNTNHLGPTWNSLGVFQGLLINPFLYIPFFMGLFVSIAGLFAKKKDKSDVFNLILIATVLFAFIFIIRAPNYEFRWFFPLVIGVLVFTAKGIIDVCDYAGSAIAGISDGTGIHFKVGNKLMNFLPVIFILIILSLGLYANISTADFIIKNKVNTYADVRSAALWMKDNTAKSDILSSISYPQTAYYSERKVLSYAELNNSAQFDDFLKQNNPRFFTVSIYEPHPQWIYEWLNTAQQNKIIYPAAAWFADKEQTQPTLIVYGFIEDVIPTSETSEMPNETNETCAEESDLCVI